MRKLKTTPLIIAQTSKSDEGKKSIFGSTYFTYYARSIFELCRGEEAENDMHVALFHRWCNLDKTQPPMGFCFHFNNVGISVSGEPLNPADFLQKISLKEKVKTLLGKKGKMQTKELAEELGATESVIRVTLGRYKNVFKHYADGWGLLVNEGV